MVGSTNARMKRLVGIIREIIAREATDADDAKQLAYDVGYYLQNSGYWSRRVHFGNPRSLPNTEYSAKVEQLMRHAVNHALSRARHVGMPATLTQSEWSETLNHFDYNCAYCKQPYEVLEHFTPLPYGGTSANNCVPACRSCNKRKGSTLPENLQKCFPASVVNSISSYLASR